MIIINNVKDITLLKESFIKDVIYDIYKKLELSNDISDTPICILEDTDNVYDLSAIHLPIERKGIFNEQLICGKEESIWEFVNKYSSDGNECSPSSAIVYELVIIIADDFIPTIIIPDETWLNKDLRDKLASFN